MLDWKQDYYVYDPKMKKFIYFILIHLFLFSSSYADKIEKFSINGNNRISDKTVILFSKAKINQIINEDDINDFIKNLYQIFTRDPLMFLR